MSHFYNTTHAKGRQLKQYQQKAMSQEDEILRLLSGWDNWIICERIWEEIWNCKNVPLTSVRRAVTNLHNKGLIEKSSVAIGMGLYGRKVYAYKFKGESK